MTDTNTKIPDYPFGGHAFVWARPKAPKCSTVDRTNGLGDDVHEFRPCMVVGQDAGRRIMVLGSQYAYEVGKFEIAGPCIMPNAPRAASAEESVTSNKSYKRVPAGNPGKGKVSYSDDEEMDPLTWQLCYEASNFLENNGFKVTASQVSEDRFSINGEPEINGEALIAMAMDLGFSPSGWGR